jgi:hypothetical protein
MSTARVNQVKVVHTRTLGIVIVITVVLLKNLAQALTEKSCSGILLRH